MLNGCWDERSLLTSSWMIFCTAGEHERAVVQLRRKRLSWAPSSEWFLEAQCGWCSLRQAEGLAGIGSDLHNDKGKVLFLVSNKNVGIRYSNEAEMMVILEALCSYEGTCQEVLIVESDLQNVISWMKSDAVQPRMFLHYFSEIKSLSSSIQAVFQHMGHSSNGMVDALAI